MPEITIKQGEAIVVDDPRTELVIDDADDRVVIEREAPGIVIDGGAEEIIIQGATLVGIGGEWRAVSNIAARDAIPAGLRTEGMHAYCFDDDQTWILGASLGNDSWRLLDASLTGPVEIYVDAAGDDSGSGDAGDPLLTFYEACSRIDPREPTVIQFSSGEFDVAERFPLDPSGLAEPNIPFCVDLQVRGAKTVTTTGTIVGVSDLGITVGGSPWVIDEHKGKLAGWHPYGPPYGWYLVSGWVLSNTVDTLIVAYSPSWFGGLSGSDPLVGMTIEIFDHQTRFVKRNANYCDFSGGSIRFFDLVFDGEDAVSYFFYQRKASTVGFYDSFFASMWSGASAGDGGTYTVFSGCRFLDTTYATRSIGTIVLVDNVYEKLTAAFSADQLAYVTIQYRGIVFMIDCYTMGVIRYSSCVADYSHHLYIEDTGTGTYHCNYYMLLDTSGVYRKAGNPLLGMSGFDTFATTVFAFRETGSAVFLRDSNLSTVKPDASFFSSYLETVSLADYVTNGRAMELLNDNSAVDYQSAGQWVRGARSFEGPVSSQGELSAADGIAEFGSVPPATQPLAISDVPTGGSATAAANATAINSILAVLRARGTIDT